MNVPQYPGTPEWNSPIQDVLPLTPPYKHDCGFISAGLGVDCLNGGSLYTETPLPASHHDVLLQILLEHG